MRRSKPIGMLWLILGGVFLAYVVAGWITPGGVSKLWLAMTKPTAGNQFGKYKDQLRDIAKATGETVTDEQEAA